MEIGSITRFTIEPAFHCRSVGDVRVRARERVVRDRALEPPAQRGVEVVRCASISLRVGGERVAAVAARRRSPPRCRRGPSAARRARRARLVLAIERASRARPPGRCGRRARPRRRATRRAPRRRAAARARAGPRATGRSSAGVGARVHAHSASSASAQASASLARDTFFVDLQREAEERLELVRPSSFSTVPSCCATTSYTRVAPCAYSSKVAGSKPSDGGGYFCA